MEESKCREIDKHIDALALLKKKADDLLMTFDLLPCDLQMEGLDILQGIVTKTVRKITLGKVSSVKFIPVQENKYSSPPRAHKDNISNSESLPPLVLSEVKETGQEGKSEVPTLPLFVGSGRRTALEAAARLKEDTLSEDGSQLYIDDSSQDLDNQGTMDMKGGERLYACSECSKSYSNYQNLRRHQRVHTGEMPYTCDVCDACFRDYSSLRLHKLKHTGEKPYSCKVCSKKFKTSSDYRRHERIHTGERRFECSDCGKMFIQGYNLKQHSKIHSNDRPWSCELCNKAFRTKASLQSHTRSHLGIKKFKCQICSKSFSTKMYLRKHQVVHTRAQPYCCTICGARFNQYSNLRRHALVHSDEKPHACKMCGKQFKYINSLQYHERTHGGDRTLCQQCGLSFRSETDMHRHHCDPRAYSENLVRTISKHSVVVSLEMLDPHLLRTGKLNEQASLETPCSAEPSTGSTSTKAPAQRSPQPRIVLKINKDKLNRGNLSKRQKVRKGKKKKVPTATLR